MAEKPAIIQDPQTKAIVGVVVEHEGADLAIGATNGVVLASGGFECNPLMVQEFLGMPTAGFNGGSHNFGDGIRMAMEVGADLWHLRNYCSGMGLQSYGYQTPEGQRCLPIESGKFAPAERGAIVLVGEDGSRFLNEAETNRHGLLYHHGRWCHLNTSERAHMVVDEEQRALCAELGVLPPNVEELEVSAATAEELAALIGADPAILARTIERFNGYAASREDIEFGRGADTMRAFEGTLYAYPMQPLVLNTMGGPRRNGNAQIVGVDGEPIPGLFGAGECGSANDHYYQGANMVGDCLVFGKLAGTNAAAGMR